MCTEITALLHSTFAHCVALNCAWLPLRLTQIGKEVFLNCVALQEVVIPTEPSDTGIRAFCGCKQLQRLTPLDWREIEQSVQAEHNAFFMCDKFERPLWVELLPAEGPDSDAFDEELYNQRGQSMRRSWWMPWHLSLEASPALETVNEQSEKLLAQTANESATWSSTTHPDLALSLKRSRSWTASWY